MATTAMMLRMRAAPPRGPALRRMRVPVACILLSVLFHAGVIAAVVLAADFWQSQQSKTYIINLVPAVAARGAREARHTEPTPTPTAPRTPEPTPPAPRTAAPPDLPAAPELPARDARALPPRAPARQALPPRETLLPQLSGKEKELPPITGGGARPSPVPLPVAPRREVAVPQVGVPNGSLQGSGPVTLDVDFPYAWYIQAVHRKISRYWEEQAHEGTQPVIVFEIGRDGQVGRVSVEKTSGNALYDQAAVRAVQNANPFPELPADFKAALLRVHLSFGYSRRQG